MKNLIIFTINFLCILCEPYSCKCDWSNDDSLSCEELSSEIKLANKYADEAKEARKMDKPHNIGAYFCFTWIWW